MENKSLWTKEEIKKLPFNLLKVLNLFVEKDKQFLDTNQIEEGLGLKGKKMGGILGAFKKVSGDKDPLIYPLFPVGRGNRWVLNKNASKMVEEAIKEVKDYL